MPTIRIARDAARTFDPVATRLREAKSNTYSQAGEDGIIAAIFSVMGIRNRWCVEFGAWDGVHLSNTCRLIREEGWSAVLIEGQADRCEEIRANHPDAGRVHIRNRWIGFSPGKDTIEDVLRETDIPRDFDLLSIDIDGLDWHVWKSMETYRPRLIVVEFNPTIPNAVVFIQDRDFAVREGNSLAAFVELAKAKRYELVTANGINAFFVPAEEFPAFGIADNSIQAIRPERHHYVWSGFNGRIYNTLGKLVWQDRPVGPDELQVLDRFEFDS